MLEQLVGQWLDRYQIVELLGEGGMGGVFRARDATLQRDVAIKVMHGHFARQPNFQERFLQEARTAARLDHPGIVKVYDFGQSESLLYIVMELIRGQNLRDFVAELQSAGRQLLLTDAIQIVRQVCLAIDYAHRQGILHRDIKPDNIMLKPEPSEGLPFRPVLTDLGLAKLAEGGLVTLEGTSMGTPAYMSPEQAIGEKTDARSDVYSLGVLLYELSVGRLPFPARTLTEAIRYHTKETPPPPRSLRADLPEALEQVILKALDKDPARRIPDAAGMAEALGRVLTTLLGTPTVTPAEGVTTVMETAPSRGPSVLAQFPQAGAPPTEDRLSVLLPDGTLRTVPLKEELTIGRAPQNDLALDYGNISRQHARIQYDGKEYKVTDLNSTNGTFLGNVKLLPGVPEVWTPDKALRIGDVWLRLERATRPEGATVGTAGTIATPHPPEGPKGATRIAAFVGTPELSVEPGGGAAATLTILNQGPVVDHFQVSVSGLPSSWVPALPPLIRLLPGARQAVTVTIRPPRTSESRAGTYGFSIRVTSQDAPDQVAEVPVKLTVGPFYQSHAELRPQRLATGRTGAVAIENRGNCPLSYTVTLEEKGEDLRFEPSRTQVTIPEGHTASAEFRAQPRKRRLVGGQKSHPFTAKVASAPGEAHALAGEILSRGLIPAWLPPLVVIPLIALCVAMASLLIKAPVIESITVDPPAPLAGQPVTVRWVVQNAQTIELRPLVSGLDAARGSYTFPRGFGTSTSFTLVATNRFGSSERQVNVPVLAPTATPEPEPGAPVVEEWSVFPTRITKGEQVTIRWRLSNAESATLQPFGTVDLLGEMQDTPQVTTRYTLIAVNKGKTVQKSQEVVVEEPAPSAPVVNAFAVEPAEVVLGTGGVVRLTWDVQNADSVAIEPGLGPVGPVGSRELPAPSGDTVYTLVARNAGGEVRSQALVRVLAPTATPQPAETPTPTPQPSWEHPVTLLERRTVYNIRLTKAGPIYVQAAWSGTQGELSLMINGPGKAGAYARQDGTSPLSVSYNVTEADLAAGNWWRVTVASFGSGQASGDIQIKYESGSSSPAFSHQFAVAPGRGSSVTVAVAHRLLVDSAATLRAEASWTGTPAQLTLDISSLWHRSLYASRTGPSPLTVSYDAPDAELDRGDMWVCTLASPSATNAPGNIKLYYPTRLLTIIGEIGGIRLPGP